MLSHESPSHLRTWPNNGLVSSYASPTLGMYRKQSPASKVPRQCRRTWSHAHLHKQEPGFPSHTLVQCRHVSVGHTPKQHETVTITASAVIVLTSTTLVWFDPCPMRGCSVYGVGPRAMAGAGSGHERAIFHMATTTNHRVDGGVLSTGLGMPVPLGPTPTGKDVAISKEAFQCQRPVSLVC